MKILNSDSSSQKTQFLFESSDFAEGDLFEKDLLKLVPYGLQIATDGSRPVLLLKDEKNQHTMPVTMNAIEAGVALTQSNPTTVPTTPHKVLENLLQSLSLRIESCVFVEIRASQQFVLLKLQNHPGQESLKMRAEEAMSVCLHLNVPIYATAAFMARSRVLAAEAENIAKTLALNPEVLKSQQKYIQ